MYAPAAGHGVRNVPTRWYWISVLLLVPIAGGAAAIGGALVAVETGVGVAVALTAVLCGCLLAYEPSVRRMPPLPRIMWVLGGLVIGATIAMTVFFVLLWIAFSMTDWS